MHQILMASTNNHKIKEVQSIIEQACGLPGLKTHSHEQANGQLFEIEALEAGAFPEPDEPYAEFSANAIHKARYYAQLTGKLTLSDDSGLCIKALAGFPGVKTKDFMVECGSMAETFIQLETRLEGSLDLSASFHCSVALYNPKDNTLLTYDAAVLGTLTFPPRGINGFGFDPIFIPDGYTQTVAELGETIKHTISHRALAIKGLIELFLAQQKK